VLRRLRDETGETTTLSQLIGLERVYVDQCESPHAIRMTVPLGIRGPLHAGASGKAMLAHLDPAERDRLLDAPLGALTAATVTDRRALLAELADIARQGVAWSLGERLPDAGSVAAPITLPGGEVYGALSVCGPLGRFGTDAVHHFKPLVRDAAAEISRAAAGTDTPTHTKL
jgi:DNA-binding IclR family transcriptional regulator